jgi:aspartate kinase
VPAAVLDAREAGLHSDGKAGEAALTRIRPGRLEHLLGRGVAPVVTGFQGWHRGRPTALGRGGSDITAVALAAALRAKACELVKDPGALHSADPRVVPGARPIAAAGHRFVTELAFAGARVIHYAAAETAERQRIPLRFASLTLDGAPDTVSWASFARRTMLGRWCWRPDIAACHQWTATPRRSPPSVWCSARPALISGTTT